MRIRLREPAGQSTLTFSESATVEDLQAKIAEQTSLSTFDLKYGYPPRPLVFNEYDKTTKLGDLEMKLDGEQLIASRSYAGISESVATHKEATSPKKLSSASNPPPIVPPQGSSNTPSSFSFADFGTAPSPPSVFHSSKPISLARKTSTKDMDAPELPLPSHGSTMILRIMPDDNSCLFRAFNSAFLGTMDNMHELRSVIAQHIQSDPDTYSEVVLDQKPDDYCRWIQTQDAWGGAIELGILSKHFEIEICSIDVQTLRVDRYGEGLKSRCILVYSGIHYDTIALSPSDYPHEKAYNPPEFDTKVFDPIDGEVLGAAMELCTVLKGRHYYTDTAAFSIRCKICGAESKGEKGAVEHATKTGHWEMEEV